jgi:predicted Zn finger-like uncharacterized protein
MRIVCPNCTASYDVKPEMLGETGRKVRCINCRSQWLATPSWLPVPVAAPPAAPSGTEQATVPALPVSDFDAQQQAADEAVGAPFAHSPAPPQTPGDEDAPPALEAAARAVENIETAAAAYRLAPPPRRRKASGRALPILPTVIMVQLVAIGALLVWRDNVVRVLPQTATLFRAIGLTVNLRGLAFSDLRSSQDVQDGVAILFIDGTVQNVTGAMISVPRLRFALRDASGSELLSWTAPPDQGRLGPGESLPFRSRLASPPAAGRDVAVRFVNRLDFTNGAH